MTITTRSLVDLTQEYNVRGYGATGNGVTDDTNAINSAISAAVTATTGNVHAVVFFPPGTYLITSTPWGVWSQKAIKIQGGGSSQTFITASAAVSGPVFAWSECWISSGFYGQTSLTPSGIHLGPAVMGISITGDRTSSNTQVGLKFYDRADQVYFNDVFIGWFNGGGIIQGELLNATQTYMRESTFMGVRIWHCGAAGIAAFQMFADGTGDATNEIDIIGLNIYAPHGPGVAVSTNHPTVRSLRFTNLRVEGLEFTLGGNLLTGDLVSIGTTSSSGQIFGIRFINSRLAGPYPSYACLKYRATSTTVAPYASHFQGSMEGEGEAGGGNGIDIDCGRLLSFEVTEMDVTGTSLITSSNTGSGIAIDPKNNFAAWTTSLSTITQSHLAVTQYSTF